MTNPRVSTAAAQRHSTSPVPENNRSVSQIPPQIRSPQLNQTALTQKLRDGWYPVGFGFSTLVPKDVRSWGPVLAILDSMKLVHLGSCVQDEQLLLEGRKRFLLAMNCLRGNLGHEPSIALPGLMLVSIGISMTEVSLFPSMSSTRQVESMLPDRSSFNIGVLRECVGADRQIDLQRNIRPSDTHLLAEARCRHVRSAAEAATR
jgi:hypothetical protein